MPKGNPKAIRPGDRFGELTVQDFPTYDRNYGAVVECRCSCGGWATRIASQLRTAARKARERNRRGPGCQACAWQLNPRGR